MNLEKSIKCSGSYLSENIERFPFAELQTHGEENLFGKPDNRKHIRFIDKGITGCGGTTLVAETALNELKNVVCLLPSVSAVQSKELQFLNNPYVQCVYGSKRLYALRKCNIVFATYDQINNILLFLGERSKGFLLVVDEYHTFTRDVFRNAAMRAVLESFGSFASVTLLTATPDKYFEETVEKIYSDCEISKIKYEWPDCSRGVTVYEVDNVQKALVTLVNKFKNDDLHLYIMLNSVNMAQRIVAKTRLQESEYHIHCSKSQESVVNRSNIEAINNNAKSINFLTAAGFEGCDINDPLGIIVTVVDVDSQTCMFDWQTIVQMQGRCRGSRSEPAVLYHSSGTLNDETKLELNHRMEELKMKNRRLNSMTFDELTADEDCLVLNNKPVINPFSVSQVQRRLEVATSMLNIKDFKKYLESVDFSVKVKKIELAKGPRVQVRSFKKQVQSYMEGKYDNLHDLRLIESLVEKYGKEKLIEMIEELDYSKSQLKRLVTADSIDRFENYRTILGLHACTWYSNANIVKRIEFLNETTGSEFGTRYVGNTLMELGYRVNSDKRKIKGKQVRGIFVIGVLCESSHSFGLKIYKELSSIERLFSHKQRKNSIRVSISTMKGRTTTYMRSSTIEEAFQIGFDHPTTIKSEEYLMSEGYAEGCYRRKQENLRYLDCVILDIDNGGSIKDFNAYVDEYMGGAFHWLYETHSSTPEHNKFRVVFPLTSTIEFYDEDYVRAYKAVKVQLFPDLQDTNCPMWISVPYKEVREYGNENVLLCSEAISGMIDDQYVHSKAMWTLNKEIWTSEEEQQAIDAAKAKYASKESILERINGATAPTATEKGDRENTIFRAVNWLRKEDIEWVYDRIAGSDEKDTYFRKKCFKEKVDRKLRNGWKTFG